MGRAGCVGIAPTKTLAKLANHIAKKRSVYSGVCDLAAITDHDRMELLASIEVGEVWGVGRRIATKLHELGIWTVLDLRNVDTALIRDRFGVVLERTVRELRGEPCLHLESVSPEKQQIMCSRSFGREITSFDELRQSVLTYVARAAEKLRRQKSLAGALMVFVQTNRFKEVPQYNRPTVVPLPYPTDDTLLLGKAAIAGLRVIYREGYRYKKSGTALLELSPKAQRQTTLFDDTERCDKRERLSAVIDQVNLRYGKQTLSVAGAGLEKAWKLKAENRSPGWTTQWAELPVVR